MSEIRKGKGVTLDELAHKIGPGMTNQYLSRVEHGKQNVTVEMLFQIATGLEVKPEMLLKDNWPESEAVGADAIDRVKSSFNQLQKHVKELGEELKKL